MGMGMGSREVKTICLREVQAALFARWQMGGLVGATPLIRTSSVSPTNVNYGGLGRVAGGKYVIGGRCVPQPSHSSREPAREVMSRGGSYHSPIHLDDGVIRLEISNH